MNPVTGAGSLSVPGPGCGMKVAEVVPEQFPAGLRVLVVDDDSTCLVILERMLKKCSYEVTTCQKAELALSILRANKNGYDLVLSDVHMPDMDGFKLLEHIGLEMDLPVIMMSADEKKSVVLKGVTHGACDYLLKPVRMEALMNIWQHVVRKKRNEWREMENSGSVEDGEPNQRQCDDGDYSSTANEGNCPGPKRKMEEEDDDMDDRDDSSTLKKPRVVWSPALHQQFVTAVNQLGIEKAVPKKILELMNVPGLTRENVASHLQKYRLYLRRVAEESANQHHVGLTGALVGAQEVSFGHVPPLGPLDLQALGIPYSGQSLTSFQLPGMARSAAKPTPPAPLIEPPTNIFSFGDVRAHRPPPGLNMRPAGLLPGVPTIKRMPDIQQQFGGFAVPAAQPGPASCESSISQISRVSPSVNQPGLPGFGSRNWPLEEAGRVLHNPQASPLMDFSSGNVFSGVCGMKSKALVAATDMGFDPSLQGSTHIKTRPPVLFRPGFGPGQTSGLSVNPVIDKALLVEQPVVRNRQQQQQQQQQHTVNPDTGVLSPSFPRFEMGSESSAFDLPTSESDKFGLEDDLLNSFLKQELMLPFEGELDLDGFVMDDILV